MTESNEWKTVLHCPLSSETEARVEIKGPIANRDVRRLIYLLQTISESYPRDLPPKEWVEAISTIAAPATMEEKDINIEKLT